jgi:hypothetical protein
MIMGLWPPYANVWPDWLVPERRMRRGGVTNGSCGDNVRVPLSMRLKVWMLSCAPPRARRICAIGLRGPRPPPITMEPSGLQSSSSLRPLEMIDLCKTTGPRPPAISTEPSGLQSRSHIRPRLRPTMDSVLDGRCSC